MNQSSEQFPNLFSPITIGNVTVKNRIVSTGHDTTLPTDGKVNDALIAYHTARAKGGAGLIIIQVSGVHESARYTSHVLMAVDDSCIEGYQKLAQSVHAHGTTLFAQLFHPGREMTESLDGSAPVAYAPSVSPAERYHVIPCEMTVEMIDQIVTGYGLAARRIQKAGVDGVEIVASHGFLPSQFLSEGINRRTDEYGGSFENRIRFLEEVIAEIRKTVGPDFVVGMRISSEEKDHEGITENVSLKAISHLQDRLDYVSVVAGTSATLGGSIHIVPPMYYENAYVAPFTEVAKREVSIPVIVTGRINQPQEAEAVIATGKADLCGMTRAMICDPQMPGKAKNGKADDIRACIACNQACIGHFHNGFPISCIQYPESGRELTYDTLIPTENPKRVMVVGGGPGGMKAAAVAAARGHSVKLFESEPQLGGQALLAQLLPGRSEFGGIVTNLSRELELSGVEVVMGTRVDKQLISSENPDAIIVAVGSKPRWPTGFEYDGEGQIATVQQILKNEVNPGASVVIADWKCDWVGMGLAEILAESGCTVRLAVNGLHAGEMLQSYVRDAAVARLHKLGVEITNYARLFGRDADAVYFQHTASNEPMIFNDIDTLVLSQGNEPETDFSEELENYSGEVFRIGDCVMARTAEEAVLEGLKVAWTL